MMSFRWGQFIVTTTVQNYEEQRPFSYLGLTCFPSERRKPSSPFLSLEDFDAISLGGFFQVRVVKKNSSQHHIIITAREWNGKS
jgi:hypothetical protein